MHLRFERVFEQGFEHGPTRPLLALAAVFAFLTAAAAPASAQCDIVRFRLWQPGGEVTWYEHSDFVKITTGSEGHIYIHSRGGRADGHYSTRARIGYPGELGLDGKARSVRQHVRMKAQNGEDRRSGRIRFVAEQPGQTWLGYQIEGVASPAKLDDIPGRCRKGALRIEVQAAEPPPGGGDPDPGTPPPVTVSAAEELVGILYSSILRRDRHAGDPDAFVGRVRRDVREGSMEIAAELTTSEEFRYEALRRTEDRHGRRELSELRRLLLSDIYRDLYGFLEPSAREAEEDLRDLDDCLSSDRNARRACETLGRNLAGNRLFYEKNRELIDRIDRRRGSRGWRQ